jgi:lipoate-protein ligase A
MALDQALLDLADQTGSGFVRLYRWQPFCLSFGRHEPALKRYDRAEVLRRGLDTVRRPTGGRAVWHARELTYAVAAPVVWFGTLPETCRAIHAVLADAVRALGVAAELAPITPAAGLASGACFASLAGGEVKVRGRKLVGSAQLRQGGAFLQHGSLLLEDDQSVVADLTLGAVPTGGEITLREAAGRPVGFGQAAEAVADAFRQLGGGWRVAHAEEVAPLAMPYLARFGDPAWTWRR